MDPRQFFEQQARTAKRREWEQQFSDEQPLELRKERAYKLLGRGIGADLRHLDADGWIDDRRRRQIVERVRESTEPERHDGDEHPRRLADLAISILGWDDLPA